MMEIEDIFGEENWNWTFDQPSNAHNIISNIVNDVFTKHIYLNNRENRDRIIKDLLFAFFFRINVNTNISVETIICDETNNTPDIVDFNRIAVSVIYRTERRELHKQNFLLPN